MSAPTAALRARLAALSCLLALAVGSGCASSAAVPTPVRELAVGGGVVEAVGPIHRAPQEPSAPGGFGPEILVPEASAADDEVARIGDLSLKKSHAFSRLMIADPKLALSAVDLLVFDVLIARHAEEFEIRVDPATVERLAAAEEAQMKQQVESELGTETDFPTYVFRMFGMRLPDWQRTLRLRTAQRLYQGYVIRYLALREDRVLVRYLVHRDEKVAEEVARKTEDGADFATLALRWSEDGRRDGGLLPAFGRDFPHPVTDVAFTLEKGQVSQPFEKPVGDGSRWFVVYCLDRFAGRDVTFAEAREEIDADLAAKPLTQFETSAYALRWRSASERPPDQARTPSEKER